jgi:hypothetical protein
MKSLRIVAYLFIFLYASCGAVFGFSTNNTTIARSFDKSSAATGELITVTVTFTNNESTNLRGFYYAEEVPQALVVNTVSVKINGSAISNYVFEPGSVGDVYPGNVVYRWILETPTAFSESHPLPSGSTAEIVYTLSSTQAGTFNLNEFSWVGYYQGGSKAAFGHSENSDKKSLSIIPSIQFIIYVSKDANVCNGHNPCYPNIQNGIAHASAPSIIEITEGTYNENIVLDVDQEITLQGGWDTNFTSSSSYTTINGSITITNGTMIFEYIILE